MRVIRSEPARQDLRKLDAWLKADIVPQVAARMVVSIRLRAKFLEDVPRGGRPHRKDERILVVIDTPHLIRYRIEQSVVQVIGVHHERENRYVEP